jgi:hypothetical protein
LYYLGARYYSPVDGIFLNVDPLAEQYYAWNAYNYVMGRPLMFIDPTGMAPEGPGDPPKPFTVTIGIHSRLSVLLTGSRNYGIMIDNQGTWASYEEKTAGGGLILGASSGVNIGIQDGDVRSQRGNGWNLGADLIIFGVELNMRDIKGYPGHEFLDVFKGGNIDTPVSFGSGAGVYFERSVVEFINGGNLEYLFDNSDMIFDGIGVPENKREELMNHIHQVNNAINEINKNNYQKDCIED